MTSTHPPLVTRRCALQTLVLAAGAGAAVEFAVSPAQAAKMGQQAVAYQSTPKGANDCAGCALFEAPGSCKSVDGAISPQGWCKIWVKKG